LELKEYKTGKFYFDCDVVYCMIWELYELQTRMIEVKSVLYNGLLEYGIYV